MGVAEEAQQEQDKFTGLVKEICTKEGFYFKSGVKLESRSQEQAMLRVKEKMLAK